MAGLNFKQFAGQSVNNAGYHNFNWELISSYGTALIRTPGIIGVTPSGGVSGGASTLQAMLTGIVNYASSLGISGSGVAGRVGYWSGPAALTSSADFLFTDSTGGGTDTTFALINTNSGATNGTLLTLQTATSGLPRIVFKNNSTTKRMIASENSILKFYNGDTNTNEMMMAIGAGSIGFGHNVLPTTYEFLFSYATSQGSAFGLGGPIRLGVTNAGSGGSAAAQIIVQNTSYAGIMFQSASSLTASWQLAAGFADNSLFICQGSSYLSLTNIMVKFWDTTQSYRTDFLLGDISVGRSASAADVTAFVTNSNNASATARAIVSIKSGGASGGDALAQFIVTSSTTWSMGADNSDTDAFVISENASLGTSNRFKIATGGIVSVAGRFNLGGSADTSGYGLNLASGDIATASSGQLKSFGIGAPSDVAAGNSEFLQLYHSGTSGVIGVTKTGAGSFRSLVFATSNIVALTIDISQISTFAAEVKLSSGNTINSSVDNTVSHKVKMNVGGVDYYLLANTSNA